MNETCLKKAMLNMGLMFANKTFDHIANSTYLTMQQSHNMDSQICVKDHQPKNFNNLQPIQKILKIRLGLSIDLKNIARVCE